jgi:DNA polymerase-3 subunit gamma/tau
MSYQVIARKWRPQAFDEVTGQEHITQTLRNAIEHGRLHHAYLFSGARGVGKTTTARLLAKAVNCHKSDKPTVTPCASGDPTACPSCIEIAESRSMDVLEIDAASHTGIDDVRDTIIENINIKPARDRYKVFIIDEIHQLSRQAFNALLKTLEEPPPDVLFIMATTELHKVPDTIASRCQEFIFRTIAPQKIFDRLRLIADAEKIDVDDAALREIARSGEGSMRDAQSNFDQVISFAGSKIAPADVANALGIAGVDTLIKTVEAIAGGNPRQALEVVDDLVTRGQDLRTFCSSLMSLFRDLTVLRVAGNTEGLLAHSAIPADRLLSLAEPFSGPDLIRFFNAVAATETALKESTQTRLTLEMGLIRLIEMRRLAPIEKLLERVDKLTGPPIEEFGPEPGETFAAAAGDDPLEKKTLAADAAVDIGPEPPDIAPVGDTGPVADDFVPPVSPVDEPEAAFAGLDSLPSRLPPLTAEELAHFEDNRLDAAYEERLLRSGDDLRPLAGAESVRPFIGAGVSAGAAAYSGTGNGSAAAPARDLSRFMPPAVEDEGPAELPELSSDATPDELLNYARAHPVVRRAMRIFRAEIVSVEPLADDLRL